MAGNNFNKVEAYSDIFDEYKILRLYHKFRVEKSANVENDTADVDIIHWSCYDNDAKSRTFGSLDDFRKHNGDEYKSLRLYHKFRVEKSANVENDTADVDIIHWSCYDNDAKSRTFGSLDDFRKHNGDEYKILRLYHKFRVEIIKDNILLMEYNTCGLDLKENPWRLWSTRLSWNKLSKSHLEEWEIDKNMELHDFIE